MGRLTNKRRVFIEEYLQCWNATEAARRAGYKHPNMAGPRLMVNDSVQEAIQERIATKAMSADEVILRLAEQARADLDDFLIPITQGQAIIDWAQAQGKTHLVKRYTHTKQGVTIELYSAQRALELLGKAHRLFTEKHEFSGPDGGPIMIGNVSLTEEQRAKALEQLAKYVNGCGDASPPISES